MPADEELPELPKTTSDHVVAVVKAGISAIPFAGGPVASLIGDYIPTHTTKAVDKWLVGLKNSLESLGDRIDADYVNRDEFAELYKSAYLVAIRTHQEEKLRAAASLVANLLLRPDDKEKLPYRALDLFVRCIDSISIGAIQVLSTAVLNSEPNTSGIRINFEDLQSLTEIEDPHLLMGFVQELISFNLSHIANLPMAQLPDYGNYPVTITPLGVKLVRFLAKHDTAI